MAVARWSSPWPQRRSSPVSSWRSSFRLGSSSEELPQGLAQPGLVRAPLGVEGHGDVGVGQAGEGHLFAFRLLPLPKDHPPVEAFRLGDAQDEPRLRLLHLQEVLPHGHVEVGEAHLPGLALEAVPGLKPSPVEAQVGHLAHKGVHLDLEDLGQGGTIPEALRGGGEGLQDQFQKGQDPDLPLPGSQGHGVEEAPPHRLVEGLLQGFSRDLLPFQVLLQEALVRLHDGPRTSWRKRCTLSLSSGGTSASLSSPFS